MIRYIGKLPISCTVAFSGGVDSVATADFLLRGRKQVSLAFFDHGTQHSQQSIPFIEEYSKRNSLPLTIGRISRAKDPNESMEEYWRNERYRFLHSISGPVITAHHLDDAIETWIFTSLHGTPRVIPYSNGNVIRPFLATPKSQLRNWCVRRNIPWVEDESNLDEKYMRNLIRQRIVPEALKVNPGLHKTILKKYNELGEKL
jgi:tRNA(Ile)-lysidine synthase